LLAGYVSRGREITWRKKMLEAGEDEKER